MSFMEIHNVLKALTVPYSLVFTQSFSLVLSTHTPNRVPTYCAKKLQISLLLVDFIIIKMAVNIEFSCHKYFLTPNNINASIVTVYHTMKILRYCGIIFLT